MVGIASAAYACLRLFFDLSRSMLELNSERSIPVHGCSDKTLQSLDVLFPPSTLDAGQVSQDNVRFSTVEGSNKEAPAAVQIHYEEVGPVLVSRSRYSSVTVAKRRATELTNLVIGARPEGSLMWSSLHLYHLWRVLEYSCDDIEALMPQPQSNLPAMILEVIERMGLPYDVAAYEALQKMALVQLKTRQKLPKLEYQTSVSWLQELPLTKVNQLASNLMAVILAKIKAEEWITDVARKGLFKAPPKPPPRPCTLCYVARWASIRRQYQHATPSVKFSHRGVNSPRDALVDKMGKYVWSLS